MEKTRKYILCLKCWIAMHILRYETELCLKVKVYVIKFDIGYKGN